MDLLLNQRLVETGSKVKVLFEAADSLLDQTDIQKSHMSILCTGDGLSFCLLNNEKKKYVLLGHYKVEKEEDHKELFEFLDRFQQMPDDVSLAVLNQRFAIIPKSLFDESNLNDYLSFSIENVQAEVVFKTIDKLVLVYENPESKYSWLVERIPHLKFLNNAEVAIHYYLSKTGVGSTSFTAHFFNEKLELTVLRNGRLELHNVFNCAKPEDAVYFILNVFEQLKLNPIEQQVTISGNLKRKSEVINLLKQYIKNIDWESRPEGYTYSYTFNEQEEHFNNRLFQQHLCGL